MILEIQHRYNSFSSYYNSIVYKTKTNIHYSQSLVRNRTIEKVSDPKPILSQTGSPYLPTPAGFSKHYRPTRTQPLPRTFGLPVAIPPPQPVQPYHEKNMIDKLQSSLSRITVRPRPQSAYGHPYPSTPNIYQTVKRELPEISHDDDLNSLHVREKIAQFQNVDHQGPNLRRQSFHVPQATFDTQYQPPWSGTLQPTSSHASTVAPISRQPHVEPNVVYSKHEASDFGSVGPLKVINNQYNTPIGLYSKNNINVELDRQIRSDKFLKLNLNMFRF